MILRQSFYARPVLDVARELVGKYLTHGELAGRIVETEAYGGPEDLASHARFGMTPRSKIMFGPAGVAYVYLIYGMYECFNVVTGGDGEACAVLIRAVAAPELAALGVRTDGPGRLCRALGITRAHNGTVLGVGPIGIEDRREPVPTIVATPRVGVDYAGEWALKPWRFVDAASSAPRTPRAARKKAKPKA